MDHLKAPKAFPNLSTTFLPTCSTVLPANAFAVVSLLGQGTTNRFGSKPKLANFSLAV
jgi:hypothetical protein